MSRQRRRAKGRRSTGTHFGLPHAVMDSPNYCSLSGSAVKLLNDLGRQYNGFNNGDLSAAWRIMHPRGWKSRDTLERAKVELSSAGMIELTRQGGLHCGCSLYALTWHPIDECKGKLDVSETRVPSNLWRSPIPAGNHNASPESVSVRPGIRVSGRKAA